MYKYTKTVWPPTVLMCHRWGVVVSRTLISFHSHHIAERNGFWWLEKYTQDALSLINFDKGFFFIRFFVGL